MGPTLWAVFGHIVLLAARGVYMGCAFPRDRYLQAAESRGSWQCRSHFRTPNLCVAMMKLKDLILMEVLLPKTRVVAAPDATDRYRFQGLLSQ